MRVLPELGDAGSSSLLPAARHVGGGHIPAIERDDERGRARWLFERKTKRLAKLQD